MNENIEPNRHKRKFLDFIYTNIIDKKDLKILEFGVSERGLSTKFFLDLCEKKEGELISIDINANSKKFDSDRWTFINTRDDNFSDRLTLFLLHFSFFLKNFKNKDNKIVLQEIYDFNFRQLELSIREIGYGDQSINKKMKDYINLFHSMVSEIHFWDKLNRNEKLDKISLFLTEFRNINDLIDYFDEFNLNLSKKTLNSYLKSVSNP